MNDELLAEALRVAADHIRSQGGQVQHLERGGINILEVPLTDAALTSGGYELKGAGGSSLVILKHGSNPGGRIDVTFGRSKAVPMAPGQRVKGGFKSAVLKLGKNSARAGKLTLAVLPDWQVDFSEDQLVSAIGPLDLLGATDKDGAPLNFVPVTEDTDPSGANPVGSFDGSGWELLRVMVDGNSAAGNFTTADVVFWQTPTYDGTVWFECGFDGRYSLPDTDTSAGRYRSFTVGWAGRGLGYPAVRNLLAAARTGLGFIIQGLR